MNRRKMFTAMMAAGVVPIVADHAVAMTFDDAAYLAERKDRLAKHKAEVDRIDAESRASAAKADEDYRIADGYLATALRSVTAGDETPIIMPYAHYDMLNRRNLIDFLPNEDGKGYYPALSGCRVVCQG